MVLMNKHALSSFHFTCPNSLLLFQCAMCCVLVKLTEMAGFITVEKLSWRIVRLWLPVNMLFVLMIWTSFYSLKFLNVAMVTVLKNLTNLITICGDYVFYKRSYSPGVWFSLFLMLVSALAGAFTDLTFNADGYLWQMANCFTTAAYSLYLRSVIDKVQVRTRSRIEHAGSIAYAWHECLSPVRQSASSSATAASAVRQRQLPTYV